MQQEVIPFDQNPRSFGLAAVLLIILVYASRRAISRWPFLRKSIVSWIKTAKLERQSAQLESQFQDPFQPTVDSYLERIIRGDKRNDIRVHDTTALLGGQETRHARVRQVQWDV
jgi:hypothetical protein